MDKLEEILNTQSRLLETINSQFIKQNVINDQIYKMLKDFKNHNTPIAPEASELEFAANESKFTFPLSTVEDVHSFSNLIETSTDYRNFLVGI